MCRWGIGGVQALVQAALRPLEGVRHTVAEPAKPRGADRDEERRNGLDAPGEVVESGRDQVAARKRLEQSIRPSRFASHMAGIYGGLRPTRTAGCELPPRGSRLSCGKCPVSPSHTRPGPSAVSSETCSASRGSGSTNAPGAEDVRAAVKSERNVLHAEVNGSGNFYSG